MRSASFIMEGSQKQAELTAAILRRLDLYEWKHVTAYSLSETDKAALNNCISGIREAWWPVARRLLLRCGELDFDELSNLRQAVEKLDVDIRGLLGQELLAELLDPVDAYYVSGSLPLEWTVLDGYPLCLYAPFFRFAKPQDVLSMHAPSVDSSKLVIAPTYSKSALAGINQAVVESAILVRNDPTVTLLEGSVDQSALNKFRGRQFARLLFHGHGTGSGMLASDGTLIPYPPLLELVQGPAFLLGCSTGAFELGSLDTIAQQIPTGLHGALLTAFPVSGDYTRSLNLTIMGTFRTGDARRVQHIAHMSRLAMAYMGVMYALARLAGLPIMTNACIVTPFEADYEPYDRWAAGVNALRAMATSLESRKIAEVVLPVATTFAMAITSCGTPTFLLPNAPAALVELWKLFSRWDGKS
jgi:hypothetical protein